MRIKTVQDILPLVEKPSQYLGTEINSIRKKPDSVALNMCLAFPDLYEIGTSHFGMQILYHLLNLQPDIAAERVFAPGVDMEAHLRSSGIPITSLESKTPLSDFHILGFSLLYELNYTNILTILELAGIPFFAAQRDASFPLVIAGGPCMCNPEPVADFFDAIVVGDGEDVILSLTASWLAWREGGKKDKDSLLKAWSQIEGVYIPSYFNARFTREGFQVLEPKEPGDHRIKRAIRGNFEKSPFPDAPIVPFGRPVHDRLRLEVARGCTRGCRFCQAGMIYRPVRERSMEALLSMAEKALAKTGYEDISLLSLSTGDYSCLSPLIQQLLTRYAERHVAVSLPSFRAGTLDPGLMDLIQQIRKTGFTIAPEAGTQRLRDIINKNVTEEDIFKTVEQAFGLGWTLIKLYFMTGLPFETREDLQGIVDMVKKLRQTKNPERRRRKINVSVTTFILKPHVPFQWEAQMSLDESREKIAWLKRHLSFRDIHYKWQQPEVSRIEGLFSRGDRTLSRLLVLAYEKGCRFDGWSDSFNYRLWKEAFVEAGVDVDFYTTRPRELTEPLPWDHIDIGVSKDFLQEEWRRAENRELTSDCREEACNECGVCDFKQIQPEVVQSASNLKSGAMLAKTHLPQEQARISPGKAGESNNGGEVLEVTWSKRGQARYFGHLELMQGFFRAVSRAEIPIRFSKGFHPKPRISFEDPLPLGMESVDEKLWLTVSRNVQPRKVIEGLNTFLPDGLRVMDCRPASPGSISKKSGTVFYKIDLPAAAFDADRLKEFHDAGECVLSRKNRKGKLKKINLKDMIDQMNLEAPNCLSMTIRREPGKTVRPHDVMTRIFGLSESEARQARVIKMPAGTEENRS